jgi:hypothetical protein
MAGGYKDDDDSGETFTYTGAGGQKAKRQVCCCIECVEGVRAGVFARHQQSCVYAALLGCGLHIALIEASTVKGDLPCILGPIKL